MDEISTNTVVEVNLHNGQTTWNVTHYAPFIPQADRFVKGGDVVRLYHQEVEGLLQCNIKPLFGMKQHQGKSSKMQ